MKSLFTCPNHLDAHIGLERPMSQKTSCFYVFYSFRNEKVIVEIHDSVLSHPTTFDKITCWIQSKRNIKKVESTCV